jgi:hypothetical protein
MQYIRNDICRQFWRRAMLDFNSTDLAVRTVLDERAREALRHSHRRATPGLRARLAAKLVRMAISLDGETARGMFGREMRPAGR